MTWLGSAWEAVSGETELWAALLGAVIGGGISLWAAKIGLREARKQRAEDRDERQKALANSMIFKLRRIYSTLANMNENLERAEKKEAELKCDPWQTFKPIINVPGPIYFTSDEMALLLSLKDNDLFNEIAELDEAHNALLEALKEAGNHRRSLTDQLKSLAVGIEGDAVTGEMSEKQMRTLRPTMLEVDSLIIDVRINIRKDTERSGRALEQLVRLLREKVGITYQLQLVKPAG
ncbi:MAG TPA: hypothetical protein VF601_12265 [Beijerinckiaceae bacterium]|jgi:hypothetical protein